MKRIISIFGIALLLNACVSRAKLQPYLTVVPQEKPQNPQPNPLGAIIKQLPSGK